MDVVRFGRALGFGARQAVKTVTSAVDAATADNPSGRSAGRGASSAQAARPQAGPAADSTQTTAPAAAGTATSKAIHQAAPYHGPDRHPGAWNEAGAAQRGTALWPHMEDVCAPVGRAVAGGCGRRLRALRCVCRNWSVESAREWHSNAAGHRQLLGALAMLAVFGYFCVSSFVRARRRERRR